MAKNQVTLTFAGDSDKLEKTFGRVGESASKFGNSVKRVGETAAGVFAADLISKGVESVTNFVSGSVEAFSNLNESVNAVGKVFGNNAGEIKRWGEQNANSLGLSTRAFNELATPLGALLKNAGLSLNDTTQWTEKLTERAADMASVFNTDVSTALEAIQAGLRGESDPLEQFGVSLSAAKVEAEALAETGKKQASALTDQELATARLNLIMNQTKDVAGDFRGTSDGLANSQRIAAAKTEELQAQIGQKLAPAVLLLTQAKLKLTEVIADKVLPVLTQVGDWMSKNQVTVAVVAAVIGGALVAAFVAWAVSAAAAAVATIAATWPILAIGAAIGLLIVGIILLAKHWDQVWAWIKNVAGSVADWIVGKYESFLGFIRSIPGRIGAAFSNLANIIIWPYRTAFNFIADAWNNTVGRLSWSVPSWVPGIGGNSISVPHLPHFHKGGTVPGAPGSEMLAVLQAGERVTPAGASGAPVVIELRSSGSRLDDLLVEILSNAIRVKGGNVQTVLGTSRG